MSMDYQKDIDVLILCGGMGTRLKNVVNDRPKPMAEISGRPFLDILITYAANYGYTRFILCTGYKGNYIKEYYKSRNSHQRIFFSEETEPLNTAGAIKNAEGLIQSNTFLVMNGDSYCQLDLREFLEFHINKNALASIALVSPEKDSDYGVVRIDRNKRITDFSEKAEADSEGFINAGMYLFDKDVLNYIPMNKKYSLEYDLFPCIIGKGIYGYLSNRKLIDIGTPERFRQAESLFAGGSFV